MQVDRFRRMLREFSRQSRGGQILPNTTRGNAIAVIADQLDRELGTAVANREIKSDTTISFSPDNCPCCGK
jgi:hypothetical protein